MLFNLFPNLITKESYNWWVTRRFWGFRQQISKAKISQNIPKYPKISQNVSGTYREASGEHHNTVQNWLRNSSGERCRWIRICLIVEVETPSSPIRICLPDVKHPENVERHPARISDVKHLGGMVVVDFWM